MSEYDFGDGNRMAVRVHRNVCVSKADISSKNNILSFCFFFFKQKTAYEIIR